MWGRRTERIRRSLVGTQGIEEGHLLRRCQAIWEQANLTILSEVCYPGGKIDYRIKDTYQLLKEMEVAAYVAVTQNSWAKKVVVCVVRNPDKIITRVIGGPGDERMVIFEVSTNVELDSHEDVEQFLEATKGFLKETWSPDLGVMRIDPPSEQYSRQSWDTPFFQEAHRMPGGVGPSTNNPPWILPTQICGIMVLWRGIPDVTTKWSSMEDGGETLTLWEEFAIQLREWDGAVEETRDNQESTTQWPEAKRGRYSMGVIPEHTPRDAQSDLSVWRAGDGMCTSQLEEGQEMA